MAKRKFSDRRPHTKRQQQAGAKSAKKKMPASRKLGHSIPIITLRWGNKKLEIDNFVKLLTSFVTLVTAVVGLIAVIVTLIAANISHISNMQVPSSAPTATPSYTISALPTITNGLANTSSANATAQPTYIKSPFWIPTATVTPIRINLPTESLQPKPTRNVNPLPTTTTILLPTVTLTPVKNSTTTSTSTTTAVATNVPTGTPLPLYTSTTSITPTYISTLTNTPSIIATATSSYTPTYTPSVTSTSIENMTPTPSSTASPSSTPTPSNVPTSLVYTPTYVPTLTPTPIPTDHNLYVTGRTSCRRWDVNASTDPSDAVINYSPAHFGDWAKENRVRVVVTALWSDGTSDIKEVKLQKPEDCEDTTLTQASTPLATSTPVWTQTQTTTATPSLSYTLMPTPPINEDVQGCAPGYWKNHLDSWQQTGYSPTDDFDTVFQVNIFSPDITLEQAINLQGGGDGRLARHGVAALLNASDPETNYPLMVQQVIAVIQAGDIDKLAEFNELDCPLH